MLCVQTRNRRTGLPVRSLRKGVTLIELLAVLTLIGIITATAVLKLGGASKRAKFEWAIERLESAEGGLRMQAAKQGQEASLRFRIGKDDFQRSVGTDAKGVAGLRLGGDVTVSRLLSRTRDASTGEVTIDYSVQGVSETFALLLRGRGDDQVWLLFAGTTGQATRLYEEEDVQIILETIGERGVDAG